MKTCFRGISPVLIVLIVMLAVSASSQKMMTFSADELFLIPGAGVGIVPSGDDLVVEFVMSQNMPSHDGPELDLQKGDLIIMLNGKRVKTIKDMETNFAAIAVGDEVQFGIKRDGTMMIVSFEKPTEEQGKQSGLKVMTITSGGDSQAGGWTQDKEVSMDGMVPLPEAGLVIGNGPDGLMVIGNIKTGEELTASCRKIQTGDKVVSINGKKVASVKKLNELLASMESGATVELVYERAGQKYEASFTRINPEKFAPVK